MRVRVTCPLTIRTKVINCIKRMPRRRQSASNALSNVDFNDKIYKARQCPGFFHPYEANS